MYVMLLSYSVNFLCININVHVLSVRMYMYAHKYNINTHQTYVCVCAHACVRILYKHTHACKHTRSGCLYFWTYVYICTDKMFT